MKSIERVRFWLLVIWFAAIIIFVGAATQAGTGLMIFGSLYFWLAFVVITVLCVLVYFILKRNLEKN